MTNLKTIFEEFDKDYYKWEAEIMNEVYELIRVNFDNEIIADANQIIPIKDDIKHFLTTKITELVKGIELEYKKDFDIGGSIHPRWKFGYNQAIDDLEQKKKEVLG